MANATIQSATFLLTATIASFGLSMEPLNDRDLSTVAGQDGLSLGLGSDEISIDSINWTVDSGTANEATLSMEGISVHAVGSTGLLTGGEFESNLSIDIGGNGSTAALAISAEIDRVRTRIDAIRHSAEPGRSYGTLALDASASIDFSNTGGIFNSAGFGPLNNQGNFNIRAEISGANLFYRQLWHQHPYLTLSNLNAFWEIDDGVLGLDDGGLRTAASFIDVALDFDVLYKFPVHYPGDATEFIISGNERPITHFGWLGTLKDAELIWRAGGAWYGTSGSPAEYDQSAMSEGLNFSSRWNYVNYADTVSGGGSLDDSREFRWQFGEGNLTPDQGIRFELSDWRNLPGAIDGYGHNFPLIAMDVINAGQDAGGLCWGGSAHGPDTPGGACSTNSQRQLIRFAAGDIQHFDQLSPRSDAKALALLVRDGNLLTYSNKIRLIEDGAITREFNWGLIYTLANLDANIYFYPGGNPSDIGNGSLNQGIIADILVMSQSMGASDPTAQGFNWDQGSHFMIADTEANKGIGFIGASFLVAANDTRIWLRPDWSGSNFYDAGIDLLSPQARINFRATFGGGSIPDGSDLVRGAYIDANLEGLINLRLSPSRPGATIAEDGGVDFMGFSMAARLTDTNIANFSENTSGSNEDFGSFISLSEPGRPDVDLKLGNINGDIALVNGVIDLRGTNEEGDGFPKLALSGDLQFGLTANPRMINAVEGSSLPGGNSAQPFRIDRIAFSGNTLGSIVIPSGQWHASMILRPQTP